MPMEVLTYHCDCFLKQGLGRRLAFGWAQCSEWSWRVRGWWITSDSWPFLMGWERAWPAHALLIFVPNRAFNLLIAGACFFAIGMLVNVALPVSCIYVWILIGVHGAECAGGQWEGWVLPGNIQPDTMREKEEKKMMSVWSVEKGL